MDLDADSRNWAEIAELTLYVVKACQIELINISIEILIVSRLSVDTRSGFEHRGTDVPAMLCQCDRFFGSP